MKEKLAKEYYCILCRTPSGENVDVTAHCTNITLGQDYSGFEQEIDAEIVLLLMKDNFVEDGLGCCFDREEMKKRCSIAFSEGKHIGIKDGKKEYFLAKRRLCELEYAHDTTWAIVCDDMCYSEFEDER